jgi:hypothetical protein
MKTETKEQQNIWWAALHRLNLGEWECNWGEKEYTFTIINTEKFLKLTRELGYNK